MYTQKPDGYIYFILGIVVLIFTILGISYHMEKTEKQNYQLKVDSLNIKVDTLVLQLERQSKRIDTVYIILNNEVLKELKNNSNTLDSLGNSIQRLNIRTIPLVNFQP